MDGKVCFSENTNQPVKELVFLILINMTANGKSFYSILLTQNT